MVSGDHLRFLPDQHQEICSDGVLSCESKEISANNHNYEPGKGFFLGFLVVNCEFSREFYKS